MAKMIDAETEVTIQIFDDMTEEYKILQNMTVAEVLDRYTEEGCPPETEIIRCHECRYNDGGYCSMLRERTKRNGVEVRIWSQFFCAYGEKEKK